jgi:hypothetical protein
LGFIRSPIISYLLLCKKLIDLDLGILDFVKKIYDPKPVTVKFLKKKSLLDLTSNDLNMESLFPNEDFENVIDTINRNIHSKLTEIIKTKLNPEILKIVKNKEVLLFNELYTFIKKITSKPANVMIEFFKQNYINASVNKKNLILNQELRIKLIKYGLIIDENKEIASQLLEKFNFLDEQFLKKSDSPLEFNEIFRQIEKDTLEKLFYLDFDSLNQRKSDAALKKLLLDTYETNGFIYDSSLEAIMKKIEKIVEVKKE